MAMLVYERVLRALYCIFHRPTASVDHIPLILLSMFPCHHHDISSINIICQFDIAIEHCHRHRQNLPLKMVTSTSSVSLPEGNMLILDAAPTFS